MGRRYPVPYLPPPSIESKQSQSVVLNAIVPAFMSNGATKASWRAEAINSDGSSLTVLWTYTDEFPSVVPAGSTVRFRAPGLRDDLSHRFSVAFGEGSGAVTCWSFATTDSTLPFAGGLTPPALTVQKLEDEFRGPATTYAGADADGLGPSQAWAFQQQVNIAADQESAFLYSPITAQPTVDAAALSARKPDSAHSYADVLYVNDMSVNSQRRVDAVARATSAGSAYEWYFAQVANDAPGRPEHLRVGIRTLASGSLGTELNWAAITTGLGTEVGATDRSEPVWVRLEVENNPQGQPVLRGSALNQYGVLVCQDAIPPAPPICTPIEGTDTARRLVLAGLLGFVGHHKPYYVDRFIGGWEVTP